MTATDVPNIFHQIHGHRLGPGIVIIHYHHSAVSDPQAGSSAKTLVTGKVYVHVRLLDAKMADILYDMIEDFESEDRNLPTP